MASLRVFAAAALLLVASCASGSPDAPDAAQCAASGTLVDLGAMRDAANASMGYPTGGGASVDSIFETLRGQAETATTEGEHLRVLEAFVYALGDHHAHLGTNDKQSPRLVPTSATVWVESRENKIVVAEVRPGSAAREAGLREGMIVERINGKPVESVLKPPPSTSELAEAMRGFSARVVLAGTHAKDAVIVASGAESVETSLPEMKHADDDLASLSFPRARVALIRLNNSIGDSGLPKEFDRLMKQAKGANTIILDLRDTPSGGDSAVAKPLMAWFVKGTRGYQKHERGAKNWVEQVTGRRDAYLGRLIVLVDHWTGSMGEGAAIGLRSAAGAKLVGTRMAGLRGAIESFPLPCLGASVRLPVERLYSVDGTPRELAQPDVIVTEAELAAASSSEDAILGRALQLAP
jgi:carboxyl-terminal processing protease